MMTMGWMDRMEVRKRLGLNVFDVSSDGDRCSTTRVAFHSLPLLLFPGSGERDGNGGVEQKGGKAALCLKLRHGRPPVANGFGGGRPA